MLAHSWILKGGAPACACSSQYRLSFFDNLHEAFLVHLLWWLSHCIFYLRSKWHVESKKGGLVGPRSKPCFDTIAKLCKRTSKEDMLGNWNLHADEPGENLFLAISIQHPTLGNYFTAILSAKRVDSSSNSLNLALYFWLMPHKVAVWIYLQALKLWWKNVAFLDHPKYSKPKYREDALSRDQKLCCSPSRQAKDHQNLTGGEENKNRWCMWIDAQWPWS
ncbi:uncharacterized protein LOC109850049 isoform X2 [Asparagus officinalis]|uniref:uncharacterized protein LOC109850049 isoform X2 n=1 Tax=Asparagus officinalis TaxID=4686 RepID=UPI00098E60B3|nr:uncharacterized protein LOC109850049 isoform X2 [Asparagus officinalis]